MLVSLDSNFEPDGPVSGDWRRRMTRGSVARLTPPAAGSNFSVFLHLQMAQSPGEVLEMAYEVTLITGDGTGPELAEAAKKCWKIFNFLSSAKK